MIHAIPLIMFLCFSTSTLFPADAGDKKSDVGSVGSRLSTRSVATDRTMVRAASAKKAPTDDDRADADFYNRHAVVSFHEEYAFSHSVAIAKFVQKIEQIDRNKTMIKRYDQCAPREKAELTRAFFALLNIGEECNHASVRTHRDLVSFLVQRRGVPIDVTSRQGQPGLIAVRHISMLETLLRLGADPNISDPKGIRPLFRECRNQGVSNKTAAQLLIFASADHAWPEKIEGEDFPFDDIPDDKRKSVPLYDAYGWVHDSCRGRSLPVIYKRFLSNKAKERVCAMLAPRAAVRWDAWMTLHAIDLDRMTPELYVHGRNHLLPFVLENSPLSADPAALVAEYALPGKKSAPAPIGIESSDSKANAENGQDSAGGADADPAGADAE